jgi:L-seryl-tRNA(Ser) seleniumtransferase
VKSDLRSLPSVDQLLQKESIKGLVSLYGRPLMIEAVRNVLEKARVDFAVTGAVPGMDDLLDTVRQRVEAWIAPTLQSVINATGVILHTNLGRAPLSRAAAQAVQEISLGFSTLEYDLGKGQRGSRSVHAEDLLKRLTGAEAALVVNNNAAAVLLALTALARRRAVVIARSQLVEIGGGFRVKFVIYYCWESVFVVV